MEKVMGKAEKAFVDYLRRSTKAVISEQVAIAQIPCMSYRADERAAYLMRALRAAGLKPRRDKTGNVIALRKGTDTASRPTLIVSAHLDSVFIGLSPIRVARKGPVLHAPGICDDASGVANLILLAQTLTHFSVATKGDILFIGSVGEEGGQGVPWGMERFWKEAHLRDPWFLGIDGGVRGRIVTRALGTWTAKVTVTGPGGHSYISFGRPNPISVLARVVMSVAALKVDRSKDSACLATVMSGGTASNAIPKEASLTINVRSSDPKTCEAMKKKVLGFIEAARREELARATDEKWLTVEVTSRGRPGGRITEDHRLVQIAARALRAEHIKPLFKASSTDANMPMSLGLPAVTICSGGRAENLHSRDEWHDMAGRTKELAALGRIVLTVAGE
jgi:tripeptide aminopeptidase